MRFYSSPFPDFIPRLAPVNASVCFLGCSDFIRDLKEWFDNKETKYRLVGADEMAVLCPSER